MTSYIHTGIQMNLILNSVTHFWKDFFYENFVSNELRCGNYGILQTNLMGLKDTELNNLIKSQLMSSAPLVELGDKDTFIYFRDTWEYIPSFPFLARPGYNAVSIMRILVILRFAYIWFDTPDSTLLKHHNCVKDDHKKNSIFDGHKC